MKNQRELKNPFRTLLLFSEENLWITTQNQSNNCSELCYEGTNTLVDTSKLTLGFIDTQVSNGYDELVQTGKNYHKDSSSINDLVTNLSATSEELFASVKTVSESLEIIASASNDGAKESSDICNTISSIAERANEIKFETELIKKSSEKLNDIILQFNV